MLCKSSVETPATAVKVSRNPLNGRDTVTYSNVTDPPET
jgi:hypothetical protein